MREGEDCSTCARYYPGIGCNSEAELACSCCYTEISNEDRVKQITKVLADCVAMLEWLK